MIHERVRAWSCFAVVRVGALGVAAVLVLAGCSGDGEPGAEAAEASSSAASSDGATASASALASPTPTPTVAAYKPASADGPAENVPLPVMPELAKQESKEGLEAFARHWYALVNYGFETGDVEPLKQVSGPECVVCGNFYQMIDSGFDESDWMVGGKLHAVGAHSTYEITAKGQFQVLVQLSQDPYEYRGVDDLIYGTYEGFDATTVQMIEASFDSGWFVHNAVTISR